MSYPEPIWCEDQESLYKQACFFYDQYEKKFAECEQLKQRLAHIGAMVGKALHDLEEFRWKKKTDK